MFESLSMASNSAYTCLAVLNSSTVSSKVSPSGGVRALSCLLPAVQETVDLVEEIAMQYITDTVHTAMRAAAARNAGTTR